MNCSHRSIKQYNIGDRKSKENSHEKKSQGTRFRPINIRQVNGEKTQTEQILNWSETLHVWNRG